MRALGILVSLTLALAAASAQAREFSISNVEAADSIDLRAMTHMASLVEQRTRGGVTIRVRDRDASMNSTDFLIASIRNGTRDMGLVATGSLNNSVAATIVLSVPYMFGSRAALRRTLDGPVGEEILAALADAGLIGLAFYDNGARSFYARKPIRTAADMKGMAVRMSSSATLAAMIRALDAKASTISRNQIRDALAHGLVDAVEDSWDSYASSDDHQVARFYSPTEHSREPDVLVFSKIVWDGLSGEEQAVIRAAARESTSFMRKLWDEREVSARKTVEGLGSTWVDGVDKKSFIDAFNPVRVKVLADPRLQDMVNRISSTD